MICKICENKFSNLSMHVRMKHKMTMEEYEKFEVSVENDSVFEEAPVESSISTREDRMKSIFNIQESNPSEKTLQSFLDEFTIDEKTLREVVSAYKKDSRVSVTSSLKNKTEWAKSSALKYKDKDFVDVNDVFLAEVLVNEYGFKVLTVKSGNPKTYKLQKK